MKRTLIACSMLEDEINSIFEEENCSMPVLWLERGFHNTPEKLREKLQEYIDNLQDQDEILLSYGLCGNGAAGLVSSKARLVLPRFDDCINMLLCSRARKTRALTQTGHIYLTRGWTLDSEAILQQYERICEDYDEETAEEIFDMMYENYEKISVIDTGCYHIEETQKYANEAAGLLGISVETVNGSIGILRKLILGQWDENFIVKEPGEAVDIGDFEV